MNEYGLPLVHISSPYKGLVKINGSIAGETGKEGITTPVTPNGTFYISFEPLENKKGKLLMPFMRRVTIGKNISYDCKDEYLKICSWPDNVYEIEIEPPYYLAPDASEAYYKEYASCEFFMNQKQYCAYIIRDCACYLTIEETAKRRAVYAFPLPFNVESARITINRMGEVPYLLADGASEKGAFVAIIVLKPGIKGIAGRHCRGYEVTEDKIIVKGADEEEDGNTHTYTYGLGKGTICLTGDESDLTKEGGAGEKEMVKNFLLCMKNNIEAKAMEYLTMSLKEGLLFKDLKDFFGDFTSIAPPLVPPRECRETTWALKYRADNYYSARLFCFETYVSRDGRMLIDNIKEP